MTEPTDEEINRVLEEKVMGWIFRNDTPVDHFCHEFGENNDGWYSTDGGKSWACVKCQFDFDPPHNIEQAMMCAEKCFIYGKLECFFEDEQEPYRFTGKVRHQTGKWVDYGYSKLPSEAIARACYEAAVR